MWNKLDTLNIWLEKYRWSLIFHAEMETNSSSEILSQKSTEFRVKSCYFKARLNDRKSMI